MQDAARRRSRPGHTVGRSTHRRVILQREAMTITAAASCGEALRTGHTQRVHELAGVVCVCVCAVDNAWLSRSQRCSESRQQNPESEVRHFYSLVASRNLNWVDSLVASSGPSQGKEGIPWLKSHDPKDSLRQTLAISR
jgi:hypothetical protein